MDSSFIQIRERDTHKNGYPFFKENFIKEKREVFIYELVNILVRTKCYNPLLYRQCQ